MSYDAVILSELNVGLQAARLSLLTLFSLPGVSYLYFSIFFGSSLSSKPISSSLLEPMPALLSLAAVAIAATAAELSGSSAWGSHRIRLLLAIYIARQLLSLRATFYLPRYPWPVWCR